MSSPCKGDRRERGMLKAAIVVLCLFQGSLLFADGHKRIPGDVNGDGVVNFTDFTILSQNFGLTGASYDPNNPDTIHIKTTVRDTVVQTISIKDTLYIWSNVKTDAGYIHPADHVAGIGILIDYESNWIHDPSEIAWICALVRDFINENLYSPLESRITLVYHPRQTGLRFERGNGGNHRILMNLTGNHAQTIHYFAHEYAHVLGQHWTTRTGSHTWIEESMASAMAVWTLYSLYNRLYDDLEYREKWVIRGTDFGRLLIKQIPVYFEETFPDRAQKFTNEEFAAGLRRSLHKLENEPYGDFARTYKFTAAYQILHIFFNEPKAWNIIRYMSPYGPVSWEADQSFEDYMKGWKLRVPTIWHLHIKTVYDIFGVE